MTLRIALIADIHGNLPALEAVLAHMEKQRPDLIVSLGDQIGLGPYPVETLALLKARGIPCLMGNHELRIVHLRTGESPAFATAPNYALARWGRDKLAQEALDFPRHLLLDTPSGLVQCQHAGLEDPFAAIAPQDPGIVDAELEGTGAALVVLGHYHEGYIRHKGGKCLAVVGAVGMAENELAGTAQYLLVDTRAGGFTLMPSLVSYDTAPLKAAFISSGAAQADPVFARLGHEAMITCCERVTAFMARAEAVRGQLGRQAIDQEIWQTAASQHDWLLPGVSCRTYWGL